MRVAALSLVDFRCYAAAELKLPAGITVVVGANGAGKTSLLEAVGWTALGRSFRGVPDAALVRAGADQAILRAEIVPAGEETQRSPGRTAGRAERSRPEHEDRRRLVEAEVRAVGRNRVLVDRHPLVRTRDLLQSLRVTVFAPDDLALVKSGPAGRRTYLDDLLVAIAPRYDAVRSEYEKVLKHRNALLKGGVRSREATDTLDVFDQQLATAGAELITGRLRLIERLTPTVDAAYRALAGTGPVVTARYEAEWAGDATPTSEDVHDLLTAALSERRRQEMDRGVTLVGPHRDEWRLSINDLDSRTHASQGEQRTLALALRLGGHHLCTDVLDDTPVLLLDDVFSELDPSRADALVAELPHGQAIITTASEVPAAVHPDQQLRVDAGQVHTA